MKIPSVITDKSKRDDLKEKIEVIFAAATIIGFTAKKLKQKKEDS